MITYDAETKISLNGFQMKSENEDEQGWLTILFTTFVKNFFRRVDLGSNLRSF